MYGVRVYSGKVPWNFLSRAMRSGPRACTPRFPRVSVWTARTTKSGHPILLSRIRPRRPADFDDRFEVAHALLTAGTRWPLHRVRARSCENPFREGEGRCQTVFFVGRTKGSKKHVPRGKKIEKEVTRI